MAFAVGVAAGTWYSLAWLDDGTVLGWGRDQFGQTSPPAGLSGVIKVSTSSNRVLALKSDGTIVGWGDDFYCPYYPPGGVTDVVDIATSYDHSLALKSDGTIVGWGDNTYGQASHPSGLTGVVAVSAFRGYSMALKSDGTVYSWGSLAGGSLEPPAGLSGVSEVFAQDYTSCALKSNGELIVWGDNTPPDSLDLTDIISTDYGVAVRSDGSVVAWGSKAEGDDAPPSDLSGVDKIAVGIDHGLALLADGSVQAWGDNYYGQCDVPLSISSSTPRGEIDAALLFTADLAGYMAPIGEIDASLEFAADISGTHPAGIGAINAELDFVADIEGEFGWRGDLVAALDFDASFAGFQDWTTFIPLQPLQEIYRLIITGSPDAVSDLVIGGISSWQATNQADGRSSYLQAVIPAADGLTDELEARENGELIIQKGYRFEDGSERYEEILRSEFDTFRWDQGPSRFTATVSGYLSGKIASSGKRPLTGVRSLSMTNGKHRTRCDIDLFLQPGMLVVANDVTFKAGYINYYVNQTDKFCEVGER